MSSRLVLRVVFLLALASVLFSFQPKPSLLRSNHGVLRATPLLRVLRGGRGDDDEVEDSEREEYRVSIPGLK
jgi:hypothetical protein